jgi:ketosteroid isomerase-like protein
MDNLGERIEGFWEAFESGDIERSVREYVDDDCVMKMPGQPELRGRAAMRAMFEAFTAELVGMKHETLVAVERGDVYAAETRYRARTPAGKIVTWESADVVRFRSGKIVSWHVHHDPSVLGAQLAAAG